MSKHTKNPKRYIGVIGDMDPITHGGGIVYYPEGGKSQGPWMTYFQPGDGVGDWDDADATVEVYSFPVGDDVVSDMDWVSWDEMATSFDIDVEEIQMHARSEDPLARAQVYEMIGQSSGFIQLDDIPQTVSYKAAERKWGRRVDAAHKAATKARRATANPMPPWESGGFTSREWKQVEGWAEQGVENARDSVKMGIEGADEDVRRWKRLHTKARARDLTAQELEDMAETFGLPFDGDEEIVFTTYRKAMAANPGNPTKVGRREQTAAGSSIGGAIGSAAGGPFGAALGAGAGTYVGWYYDEIVGALRGAAKGARTARANPTRNRSTSGWQRVEGTTHAWFNRLGSRVSLLLAKAKGPRSGSSDKPYRLVVDVEGKGMVRLGSYARHSAAMAEGDRYIQTLTAVCGQLEGRCPNPAHAFAARSLSVELRQAVENAAEPPYFNRRDFVGLNSRKVYDRLTRMGLITLRDGVVRVTPEGQGIALAVHKMHEDVEYEPWNRGGAA